MAKYLTENDRWCKAIHRQMATTCATQTILPTRDTDRESRLFPTVVTCGKICTRI